MHDDRTHRQEIAKKSRHINTGSRIMAAALGRIQVVIQGNESRIREIRAGISQILSVSKKFVLRSVAWSIRR